MSHKSPEILQKSLENPPNISNFLSIKTPILNQLDFQNFVAVEVQEEDSGTSMITASTILENSCFKAFSDGFSSGKSPNCWIVSGIKLSFVSRNSEESTWLSQKSYQEICLIFLIILIFSSYRGNF